MGKTFFTSDLHLGHERCALKRGFEDTASHDRWVEELWRAAVGPDDSVFVLGDISSGARTDRALELIASLPGRKELIAGNHDQVHPMHTERFASWTRKYDAVFDTVHAFRRRRIDGTEVALSHFPYASWGDGPERPGSRHDQWRLPDLGMPLLHGHTHGPERGHDHSLHVGLDAWGRLVGESDVVAWLRTLPATAERRGLVDAR